MNEEVNESAAAALEDESRRALDGDRDALDRVVRALQGDIYGLALRMLCNREDAEDATQEILVRIVTRLSQFDFRSKLKTWAYRVAVNYILDVRKSPVERLHLSFERFADDLTSGLDLEAPTETERSLLIEEVKVGCTFGMLQCLDRPHRLAYVLGEIMEIPGPDAAEVLEISPDLFRKRLQHRPFRHPHASPGPIAASHRTPRRAGATGNCLRRCGRARFATMAASSRQRRRRSRRRAPWSARSRRRDGRSKSIAQPSTCVVGRFRAAPRRHTRPAPRSCFRVLIACSRRQVSQNRPPFHTGPCPSSKGE